MIPENTSPPSENRVELRGDLTVATAEDTRTALLDALEGAGEGTVVTVNCSQAEAVDLSFVQTIVAARRSAREKGAALRLAAPADGPLLAVLEGAGFIFGDGADHSPFWNAREGS